MLEILKYVLTTVEIICSFLLLLVILVQKTKGQGMGMAFGGAMGESLFGAQVGNVLTRTTVILAIIFLVNTTFLALLGARGRSESLMDSVPSAVPLAGRTAPAGIPAFLPDIPAQVPEPDVSPTAQPAPSESDQPTAAPEPAIVDPFPVPAGTGWEENPTE